MSPVCCGEDEFNARPVHMGFFMVKVALEQDFLLVLLFPPVSIFPSMNHSHTLNLFDSLAE